MKFSKLSQCLMLVVMLFGITLNASAQVLDVSSESAETTDLSQLDSSEAVTELVSQLTDKEVRNLLLEQLDAVAVEQSASSGDDDASLFTLVTSNVPLSVQKAVNAFPRLMPTLREVFATFGGKLGDDGYMGLLKEFVIVILLGLAVEFLVRTLTSKLRERTTQSSEGYSLGQVFKVLTLRLILDLSGLIAFMIVTQIALKFFVSEQALFVTHHFLWNLILIPRLFYVFLKFVFAPERSDLRLVHTSDESAKFLRRHLVGVAIVIGLTLSTFDVFRDAKLPPGSGAGLGFWNNLIIFLYFAFIAWRSRFVFSQIVDGPNSDATPLERRVAALYPYYALIVIVACWLLVEVLAAQRQLHLLAQGVQYSTMFILLLAPFLDTTIRALVRHLTPPVSGDGELAFKAHHSTMRCYIRMGRVITLMLVVLFIARIWDLDLVDMKSTNVGTEFIRKLLDFIGINAVGYLVWETVTLLLNRKLASEKTAGGLGGADLPGGDEGGVGGSRLSTVLPLVIWFAQTSIVIMTLLISLGSIGVDTTPLLAGAGIVGLAIGFGAQKLVGDIVSGLFFLIDDAFRAGEYVNIEGTVGTVERISLRAMQLRHHRGAIHTIPYGEIPKITNYSRDWTIMKLTFTVPFETNLMKVKKLFKKIGQELMEIPEFADDFLSPFKSQGVIQVDDVGIVIRGKFMVKPGKQFMIRKEIFNRVQSEFEKNGIQFARKEVRVKLNNEEAVQMPVQQDGAAALDSAPDPDVDSGPDTSTDGELNKE